MFLIIRWGYALGTMRFTPRCGYHSRYDFSA
jgi:hypothetical protein